MGSERIERINSLLVVEVGKIFARELEPPPGVVLTVTHAETAIDLSSARIWVSVLPATEADKALALLRRFRSVVQRQLNRRLVMHTIPKILFLIDKTEAEAARVEMLLDSLKKAG